MHIITKNELFERQAAIIARRVLSDFQQDPEQMEPQALMDWLETHPAAIGRAFVAAMADYIPDPAEWREAITGQE